MATVRAKSEILALQDHSGCSLDEAQAALATSSSVYTNEWKIAFGEGQSCFLQELAAWTDGTENALSEEDEM